jgi:hypothetical protein
MDTAAGYEVDTGGQAAVEMANGAVGLCDWGFGRAYRNEVEAWSDSASIRTERIFAKPAELETVIRLMHQKGNRIEEIAVPPANPFCAMLKAMASARNNEAARAALRADILEQAALVHEVRRHAGT